MSIKFIDIMTLEIYIKKKFCSNIDFKNEEILNKYLKNLFKTLNCKYNIKIEGFYEVNVYVDKFYGIIFHLKKEELEYYDYFKNQVDMRIFTKDVDFFYLVEDIPFEILNKVKIYKKDKNIYLKIEKELTEYEMMNLMENSALVYNI